MKILIEDKGNQKATRWRSRHLRGRSWGRKNLYLDGSGIMMCVMEIYNITSSHVWIANKLLGIEFFWVYINFGY